MSNVRHLTNALSRFRMCRCRIIPLALGAIQSSGMVVCSELACQSGANYLGVLSTISSDSMRLARRSTRGRQSSKVAKAYALRVSLHPRARNRYRHFVLAHKHGTHMSASQQTPNPSIEGMPKRLRLLCTPHVKR